MTVLDPAGIGEKIANGQYDTMRQSLIGSYGICPSRVRYERERPWLDFSGDARSCGTGYHAGIAHAFESIQDGEVVDEAACLAACKAAIDADVAQAGEAFTWTKFRSVDEIVETAHRMVSANLATLDERWPRDRWLVQGVELGFQMPWFDHWAATGTIDLVLWDTKHGRFHMVDHKTSGRGWQKGKELKTPQPHFYAHWWKKVLRAAYPDQYRNVGDHDLTVPMTFEIMTYAGKFEARTVYPSVESESFVMRQATVAARVIDDKGPWAMNIDSTLCSPQYCDHFDICPGGSSYRSSVPVTFIHPTNEETTNAG